MKLANLGVTVRTATACLLLALSGATAASARTPPASPKPFPQRENSQKQLVRVSIVRLQPKGGVSRGEMVERGEVIETLVVDVAEFDMIDTQLVGHNFGPTLGVKTAIKRHAHRKGELIAAKVNVDARPGLSVVVIAVDAEGRVFNLFNLSRYAPPPPPTDFIQTDDDETVTYALAVTSSEYYEVDFHEGLTVGRGAKKIAGAAMMNNLGAVYGRGRDLNKSIEFYELCLLLARGTGRKKNEAAAYNNLGLAHYALSRYDKAIENYQQALKVLSSMPVNDVGRLRGEASTLDNLAQVYNALARFEPSVETYQRSLALKRRLKDQEGEFILLNNLGAAHNLPGKYETALLYYKQALALARLRRDKRGEGIILNNMASAYRATGRFGEAEQFLTLSRTLNAQSENRAGEAFTLNNLGLLRFGQGRPGEAAASYRQALQIYREIGNRAAEAVALSNLMFVHASLNQPVLAIYYGKQAINLTQTIRGEISGLDKETQHSFLDSRMDTYRKLANVLVSEGRLPEAQAVLNLLKGEEYRQLLRGGEKADAIPYSQAEEGVIEKVDKLVALERERADLLQLRKETGALSGEQQKQLERLRLDIAAANSAFDKALEALGKTEKSARTRVDEIKGGQELQSALQSLGRETKSGVVALYTILGAEANKGEGGGSQGARTKFGWVILVTEKDYKAYPIDVAGLEEAVFQFRSVLSSDAYDPRPLAQKIYDAIFRQTSSKQRRTLEADLQEYLAPFQDKTLMWSLDGVLRYIPTAALHDGKAYLVENYRSVVFTRQSFLWLTKDDRGDWRALGLGVSEGREGFKALGGVETELKTIIRKPGEPTGILDGDLKLNGDFKKQLFFDSMEEGTYPVVHIASHYSFNPTQQDDSFLLVGDGHLSFADMKGEKNLFGAVDLLTLSACDTGVSGNGKEAEGFAFLAQSLGAKSVIASLWKVSDEGTPQLMIRFYTLRKENPQMSKGEAFRRAQLELLRGGPQPAGRQSASRGAKGVGAPANSDQLLYRADPQARYTHPHYWAPFILIGNWK